jgi:hypothetical protein
LIERFHKKAMSSVEASVSKAAVVIQRFADWGCGCGEQGADQRASQGA